MRSDKRFYASTFPGCRKSWSSRTMPLMARPAKIESTSHRPRRPAYQAASPSPEAEREGFQPDDDADRVGERDIRELENEQDSQRWDCEQEEPQLEARRDEPLSHRRRPSERHQLDETAREDVRRADRDNRTDDD
jgi:hypothetical protein